MIGDRLFSSRLGCDDLESLHVLVPLPALDVLAHRLLVHRAHRSAEVPSRPQVPSLVPLAQVREFLRDEVEPRLASRRKALGMKSEVRV